MILKRFSLLFCLLFKLIIGRFNKPYPDIGLHESSYVCSLDSKGYLIYLFLYLSLPFFTFLFFSLYLLLLFYFIFFILVNPSTYLNYKDEISQIWGSSCGRNRGIFVSDPPDGHTYSCGKFPPSWYRIHLFYQHY